MEIKSVGEETPLLYKRNDFVGEIRQSERNEIGLGHVQNVDLPKIESHSLTKFSIWNHIGIIVYSIISFAIILLCALVEKWELSWKGWFAFVLVFVMVGFLLKNAFNAELVVLASLSILVAATVVSPRDALSGFGNDAIVSVAVLFVVAKGVEKTGVLDFVFGKILGNSKYLTVALLRMMARISLLFKILTK